MLYMYIFHSSQWIWLSLCSVRVPLTRKLNRVDIYRFILHFKTYPWYIELLDSTSVVFMVGNGWLAQPRAWVLIFFFETTPPLLVSLNIWWGYEVVTTNDRGINATLPVFPREWHKPVSLFPYRLVWWELMQRRLTKGVTAPTDKTSSHHLFLCSWCEVTSISGGTIYGTSRRFNRLQFSYFKPTKHCKYHVLMCYILRELTNKYISLTCWKKLRFKNNTKSARTHSLIFLRKIKKSFYLGLN